jgi:hypothetical protein
MVKVFIPEVKGKNKTETRGFWKDNSGRVYYDYIKVINYRQENIGFYYQDLFKDYLENLKVYHKQEAIFYVKDNTGFIYNGRDNIEELPGRIYKEVTRENLKSSIKEALKVYGGVTIYNEAGRYYLEIFYRPEVK